MKRTTVAESGPISWLALPLFRFHPLTGDRRGTYSVTSRPIGALRSVFTKGPRMT